MPSTDQYRTLRDDRQRWFWLAGCGMCLAAGLVSSGCAHQRPGRSARSEISESLASEARRAEGRGDARSAEFLLTAAVNSNPRDCETRLQLSDMLVEHGSLEAAITHLRRLVAQYPDDPRGHVRLAQALFLQQHWEEVDQQLELALDLDPRDAQGLLLRGRLEKTRHNDDAALAALYEVLAVVPDHVEARLLISEIQLRRGNSRQAAPLLRSIVDNAQGCETQRWDAAWLLGQCYARDERWADAAAALELGIPGRAQSGDELHLVAYAHFRAGNIAAARQWCTQAVAQDPGDPGARALQRQLDTIPGNRLTDEPIRFAGAAVGSDSAGVEKPPIINR